MSEIFSSGPAARYSLGVVFLFFVSLYGAYLLILATLKNNISIKGITLSIPFQIGLGLLLQTPVFIYLYIGFYTGHL